jgi:DMSO/TMAO reductase YedYZ heme-binding membrane subunit
MPIGKDKLFVASIIAFSAAVLAASYYVEYANPLRFAVRLFGLWGFTALSIATIITAFLKEITTYLKKPFLKVHHYLAAFGLALITLHPVALAIQLLNPAIFIPSTNSLTAFIVNGGRPALIIIYVALVAVLTRRKIVPYWRPLHALMYLALTLGIVHANLIGKDFQNPFILLSFNTLYAAVIAAFALKRWQMSKIRQKQKKLKTKLESGPGGI